MLSLYLIAATVGVMLFFIVAVAPTIFGNVLVGPTAEDVVDRDDRRVTEDGLTQLRQAIATMLVGMTLYDRVWSRRT